MTALAEVSGLEQLRLLSSVDPSTPHIGRLLGMEILELGHGEVALAVTTTNVGGRIAMAEGRVVDEDGRLVAKATTTCLVNR